MTVCLNFSIVVPIVNFYKFASKKRGGLLFMENMCRVFKNKSNQKGFSLVELLIVIAIMGVLAVIAFQAFNGVLQNTKKRADEQQANNIVKATRIFITDTGVSDIIGSTASFFSNTAGTTAIAPIANSTVGVNNLIIAMQNITYFADPITGVLRGFGPYLTNPKGGTAVDALAFKPQWASPTVTNGHTGYLLEISTSTNNVRGIPVTGTGSGGTAGSFKTTDNPGIVIQT
jgi:type IV pilus assembly protein PilA